MPLYEYEREDGVVIERLFPSYNAPAIIEDEDGVKARKIMSAAAVITPSNLDKMRRDPQDAAKIKAEHRQYYAEQGLGDIRSLKGKTDDQMFNEIKKAGSFVKDSLQAQKAHKQAEKERKWKEGQAKRIADSVPKYLKRKEDGEKRKFSERKINLK